MSDLVWKRSRGKCEACKVEWGKDVHHVRYTGVPYRERITPDAKKSDVVLLCRRCHQAWHFFPPGPYTVAEIAALIDGF